MIPTTLIIVFFALAALTVIASGLLTCHGSEHLRYVRSRFRRSDKKTASAGRVAVIIPCKGVEFGLEDNLRRLLVQDYHDYEVLFVVESSGDGACRVIEKLISERPEVAVRLIVAGRASDCGQKIHNLSVASEQVGDSVETLVFVDSDAAPAKDWLRYLVSPLDAINVNVVTSYRWLVPRRASLANLLLFSVNATAMGLVCSRRQAIVWGGTWAVSRRVFEKMKMRERWKARLSDDLVASWWLDKLRLNVAFEPRCVVTTDIDYDGPAMWEFLRRQCFVGRWYRTRSWLLGLTYTTASMLTFWGGLILGAIGIAAQTPFLWVTALLGSTAMWGMGGLRACFRQRASKLYVKSENRELRPARIFDVCAYPLSLTATWLALISAGIGRSIRWRNIAYRIKRDGRIKVLTPVSGPELSPYTRSQWPGRQALAADSDPETISLYDSDQGRRKSA